MSGTIALLLFITGIPLAVYANEWDDEVKAADSDVKDTLERIPPALRAAAVRIRIHRQGVSMQQSFWFSLPGSAFLAQLFVFCSAYHHVSSFVLNTPTHTHAYSHTCAHCCLQAFCYIALVGFIVLLVWMLIHLVLGWCKPSTAASHST